MSTDPLTMMQSQVAHILSENLELRSRVSALEVTVGSLLKGEFNGKEQECGEGMKPSPEDMAVTSLTVPLSPKTRMIFEMEDEREQQETALQQIEEGYAETRQW
ncbi:hypothetical protein AOL_s00007g192 [Orbilia oligospora ATCC 24927]|uniref:Uncharacterized protein n=2 Tax=Orbilia oligospora TaxID=2813651 RepID=G1X1N3_ARTOA|nr:hypothetical protein AOL_s00007g192 [Orbilia oligospora ATCC 24927]EGX52856.1 hypothetical protein AOL_s00007g192 [Orbilia oligospora ATCC 24927]KAF3287661.1 hypothetical protein TWF970_007372 [Orbilia oligospora]